MNQYHPPLKRTPKQIIQKESEIVGKSSVVEGILNTVCGMLAVLDENRHITAVNDSFFEMTGLTDITSIIGLRPGELLSCVHSAKNHEGCGTSKFCKTCGAAIALSSALSRPGQPVEKFCAITAENGGKQTDLSFRVNARTILVDDSTFLLLFLQDISAQQQRAALERVFFHDMNNILSSVTGASEILKLTNKDSKIAENLYKSSLRLKQEMEMQKTLLESDPEIYSPVYSITDTDQIKEEIWLFFSEHPDFKEKKLKFFTNEIYKSFKTDLSILLKIISNMIINALEAGDDGPEIHFYEKNNSLIFAVWNKSVIPEDIQLRVFQKNFSTKEEPGRGLGTYSMKFFGEKILKGKIQFISSKEEGTLFEFIHPLS